MKKLIVFDLDGLSRPASHLSLTDCGAAARPPGHHQSGSNLWARGAQFEKQLLTDLPRTVLANLYLLPTVEQNSFNITESGRSFIRGSFAEQKRKIIDSLDEAAGEAAIGPRRCGER